MTQNTQTTVDRIQAIVEAGLFDFSARPSCEVIAAEIDALTADNAQANQWLVNGVAKIERLEKERDEARERGYMLERESQSRAMIDASTIAILRAEVERLRPAAEAWEAREAQRIAFETFDRDPTPGNHDALTDANMAMLGTGLRARAAKEAKP